MATDSTLDDYIGPWWDEARVLRELNVTTPRLAAWRQGRQIIGIKFNDGNHYYPARQFTQGGTVTVLSGLPDVLRALSQAIDDPETWATWLAGEYDKYTTIYNALRRGRTAEVLALAERDAARWQS